MIQFSFRARKSGGSAVSRETGVKSGGPWPRPLEKVNPSACPRGAPPGAASAPAAPALPNGEGGLIADSSTRALGVADVAGLTPQQARLARNEIFARHGFRFKDPSLQAYFGQFAWYEPTSDTVELSTVEKANVALLKSVEAGGR